MGRLRFYDVFVILAGVCAVVGVWQVCIVFCAAAIVALLKGATR